jgi:hypothetical protein
MKCSLSAVLIAGAVIAGILGSTTVAAVPVVWDGSDTSPDFHVPGGGYLRWEEGNWTKDGTPGQTATATMGDATGGRGGYDIVVGGGALVFHDQNDGSTDPGALGDFKPRMDLNGPGSLTIKEGAVLWLDGHTDPDGRWARMDIDVNIDNGTLKTASTEAFCPPSECSVSAGRIIFGYNNDLLPNTILNWNIVNGGKIEMEGKMTWGNPDFLDGQVHTGHNPGIGMHMTINDGTLDLTGGNLYDDFFGLVNGEMIFFYEWNEVDNVPKGEDYDLNFTGPGQIIVDNGLFVVEQASDGTFIPKPVPTGGTPADLYTTYTYEQLWDLGILQANGQSGMTGATFSNFFSVSGTAGMANYTLTSLLAPPGLDGDHNGDGKVDAADYVAGRKLPGNYGGDPAWYDDYRENFGESSPGSSGPVPEPVSLVPVIVGLAGLWLGRRSSARA